MKLKVNRQVGSGTGCSLGTKKEHHSHANVRHGSEGACLESTSLLFLSTSQSGIGRNCRKTIGIRHT